MKRSQRLQVVLRLYQQREDAAAEQVQTAQSQMQAQESQLAQLVAYQQDYQRSRSGSNSPSVSMAQWRRLQDYIDQLDGIIHQQERQVALAGAELERTRAYWQTQHLERRSMESAIETIAREEQMVAGRQEQKQLDEMIQQQRQRKDQN